MSQGTVAVTVNNSNNNNNTNNNNNNNNFIPLYKHLPTASGL
jgi:hypothetical protein